MLYYPQLNREQYEKLVVNARYRLNDSVSDYMDKTGEDIEAEEEARKDAHEWAMILLALLDSAYTSSDKEMDMDMDDEDMVPF